MKALFPVLLTLALVACEKRYDVDYLSLTDSAESMVVEAPEGSFAIPFLGQSEQSRLVVALRFERLHPDSSWAPWVTAGFATVDRKDQVKAFVALPEPGAEKLNAGYQVVKDGEVKEQVVLVAGLPVSEEVQVQALRGSDGMVYIKVADREARVRLPHQDVDLPFALVSSATASLRWLAD